jgi:hypothetical protein
VAVQIISNLYHNFPEQRTLIVTHSNQALNQLFEKIMALVCLIIITCCIYPGYETKMFCIAEHIPGKK